MTDPIRAQPEPAGLSDEELLQIAAKTIKPYEDCGIGIDEYEAETECAVEAYGSELIAFARAVEAATLARAQHQPVPPEPEDVQELVKWLREQEGWMGACAMYSRTADLLESLSPPQSVLVSERPWERKGWCDKQGRCWALNEHLPAWEFLDCADSRKWADLFLPAHALPLPGEVE